MKKFLILYVIPFAIISCSPLSELSENELAVTETSWKYSDSDGDKYQITFHEGGKLRSTNGRDKTHNNDFWKQTGTHIEFGFNDWYSTYKGEMKSLNRIEGTAKSVKGKWKWKLVRLKE